MTQNDRSTSSDTIESTDDNPHSNPTRQRKTHSSALTAAALKRLPRIEKIIKNKEITTRNETRSKKRKDHEKDPVAFPDDASDDSSIITLSDSSPSASNDLATILKYSPNTIKAFANIFKKRPADQLPLPIDQDPRPSKRLKDTKDEIDVFPGISLPPGFHQILYDLSYHNMYMPLSLFQNSSLRTINREATTLPLRKINPTDNHSKAPQVLDIEAFEKKYGREVDMPHHLWSEAARNYCRFCQTVDGDETASWYTRWDNHFGFFEGREDAAEQFPAILELDIRLRKDYIAEPIKFSAAYYEKLYTEAKFHHLFRKSNPPPVPALPRQQGRPRPAYNSGRPFQGGNTGDPGNGICIICARKGHFFSTCTHSTFEDGSPLASSLVNGVVTLTKSHATPCRIWNVKGDAAVCSHDEKRVHFCTFCASKSHFALSGACRKELARK